MKARCRPMWLLLLFAAGAVFLSAHSALAAPYNDNSYNAQTIEGLSGSLSGDNFGATIEGFEPGWTGSTVWYQWTAPATGDVVFNTEGSSFDTTLSAYYYDNTLIGSDDDSGAGLTSSLSVSVQQGVTYRIALGGYYGSQGTFNLTWWMSNYYYYGPPNDYFDNPQSISGASGTIYGHNLGATSQDYDPLYGPTVWYRWTAPSTGTATITTAGSNFDTLLGIYTGSSITSLSYVGYNDDSIGLASRVTFNAVAGTTYQIVVSGYSGGQGNIQLNWSLNQPQIGRIIGRITTTSGAALPNVSVALSGRTAPAQTNSAGYYQFDNVLEGSYTITPGLSGYSFTPSSRSVVARGDLTGQNFVGVAAFVISGRITNADGAGLANISVARSGGTAVTTNANGEYSFPAVPEGSYTVTPSAAGTSFTPASRTVTPQDRVANFVARFTISGQVRVHPSLGTSGIPNVSLTLTLPSGAAVTGITNPVQSNATGQYLFSNVPAGLYYITPRLNGYTFSPQTQGLKISNGPRAANFIGSPVFRVIGRVTNSAGVAIAGATVRLTGGSPPPMERIAVTNSAGYYTLTGIPAGNYSVTSMLSGYGFTPTLRSITVSSADVTGQNFSGYAAYTVYGRITNSNGVGIGGINVFRSGSSAPVTTDSSGDYNFGSVPLGSCTITPSAAGSSFMPASRVVSASNPTANFTILFSFTGRVRNSANAGIANVTMTLRTTSGAMPAGVTNPVTTDANGDYALHNIPAGLYYVTPTRPGFTFLPSTQGFKISDAPKAANFVGTQISRISGRITTSSGVAVSGVSVARTGSSTPAVTNSAGYFTFTGVPNGTYTLTPSLNGATFTPSSRTATVNGADVAGQNFIRN